MEEENQVNCSNCGKPQNASKVHLHEAYCLRNFRKCPDCDEFVDKSELVSHKQEKHTKQQCKYCSVEFLPNELTNHLKNCLRKPQNCYYCNLDVDGLDFTEHLQSCGSRTKECLLCGKSIILFNYDDHMNTCVGPAEEQPYENQFPSHQTILNKNKPQQQKQQQNYNQFLSYQPQNTRVANTRVQIGNTSNVQSQQLNQEKDDQEFARKLQQATENDDFAEIKRLQEEEDERLAREMNKDFSPKNKTVLDSQKQQRKPLVNEQFDDFDYDYDDDNHDYNQMDYQNEQAQQEMDQAYKYQSGLNNPLVFPSYQKPVTEKTKEQKEMEELGEFIDDDPELQQAILQSQMQK